MNMSGNKVQNEDAHFVAYAVSTRNLLSLAKRVAKFNVPVLITGETGTGKECVAKYIHQHAFSDNAPYVAINCAAIPETMLESVLFGYEKGAFTGAVNSQPGKFEQANGGTLLLDEIGDMPLALQVKLLRVLQEQEVERLGSHRRVKLNIRLIAATNKNLEQEVAEGRFRQDLFYRLSVVPVHIPPLRQRTEDIIPLAELFIRKYQEYSAENAELTADAHHALLAYPWPGNVRELENVVQRSLIMSSGGVLNSASLGINPASPARSVPEEAEIALSPPEDSRPIKQRGRIAEYQYICDLLKRHRGNKSKTAECLGITPRALRYRLASMRQQGFDPSLTF